jgi:uncharacterized membrane protein
MRPKVKSSSALTWIAVLAVCGVLISGLALKNHFGRGKTAYCAIGEHFDCDVVNRGTYSKIAGIPVAFLGLLGYLLLLGLSTIYRSQAETPALLCFCSAPAWIFSLYLTYLEGSVIGVWCLLCLSSLALITLILLLSGVALRAQLRKA